MDKSTRSALLDFDFDHYINPYIPHSRLHALPRPLTHFLGYRKDEFTEPPALIRWPLMFVATLAGLCLVAGIFDYSAIAYLHPPVMIASLGASAILDYNAIRSPLAQPRNVVVGHALSAVVGVAVSKLFQLNPSFFANYSWVAGAVACACASLVMSATNTVHPPGGATAVLACTHAAIVAMGWVFVPVIILACVLMTTVACLFNNILRQYPVYWWTPGAVGSKLRSSRGKENEEQHKPDQNQLEKQVSEPDSERTLGNDLDFVDGLQELHISLDKIKLPPYMDLTDLEIGLLQGLQQRLRTYDACGR
ncbi:hypothetical protein LTR53_003761 [Teratosphaeriaceae sp. CCFEE 6253]|nr:hypothetical protein LTR53_003761 [Teratosphaeriaceae sp. CCFEE 6253]